MRILIVGINYAPELTGIGKYTSEMAEWLAAAGHEVRIVTAPPYYPEWRVADGYAAWRYSKEVRKGVLIWRCPVWVPTRPSGLKRLLHLASFALSSPPVIVRQIFWRPDVILAIEPPLFCAPATWLCAKLSGAKAWLHVQDFEVDAAFELGILRAHWMHSAIGKAESWLMRRFSRVSTISDNMLERLSTKGVAQEKSVLLPNWVDAQDIFPLHKASIYRAELGIEDDKCVALYSGNMGEKQGLEILLAAARSLQAEPRLLFVLCGAGAARERLMQTGAGLHNVRWLPLQPAEKLNELLNLADVHLLPQRVDAADLVMPSKLLGMLASGRPVLATAHPGTQLAKMVSSCGKAVEPGNAQEVAQGLLELLHAPQERERLGMEARKAAQAWDKSSVLRGFENQLHVLCNK
jgi:colanic acid biosynthesis glycosyl transferase WcaI